MGKKGLRLLIFSIIFILGIVILMYSIRLGENELSGIMKAHGGSMDTNTYLIYLEQSITKYRYIGSILSILGGLGVLNITDVKLSLIHISEPTRLGMISYAVFCLKKKKKK